MWCSASSSQTKVDRAKDAVPGRRGTYLIDLLSQSNIKTVFAKIGAFDHLVYTAGDALLTEPMETLSLDPGAQAFFGVRFWGSFLAVKYARPNIRAGGSVVLSSGMAARRPRKGSAAVSAVCGAAESLTRALAVDLAPLRVNVVCPGFVKTELWSDLPETERQAMHKRAEQNLLVGRPGEALEVAEAYLYLMKSGFSTGEVIVVDGGASVA